MWHMRKMRNAYRVLVSMKRGDCSRRSRLRWAYNIKTAVREIGFEGVVWINLAQNTDLVMDSCEHSNEHSDFM
jgi:hypothetical protein